MTDRYLFVHSRSTVGWARFTAGFKDKMRQFCIALCAAVAGCGFAASVGAVNPPLTFTLDLQAPCDSAGACSGNHPTDLNLQLQADDFSYAQDSSLTGQPFVATLDVDAPVVCDEVSSGGVAGAVTSQRLAPNFSNVATGGLLEFNAGGATIVDLGSVLYDGTDPAGVAGSYSNYGATLPPQVTCYRINPVTGGPQMLALGPSGIFLDGFDGDRAHFGDEPWVSVQTVNSPSAQSGSEKPGSPRPNSAPLLNQLVYVLQIHNANSAIGWRLNLGYDSAFFDPASNGMVAPQWCVLPSGSPQPGELQSCGTGGTTSTSYTLDGNDIQGATNSVYLQVVLTGSSAAVDAWSSLSSATYPATASVFPRFGTYPQRFDDKSAVVGSNNRPVLNVGSIVCNNDTSSTSCMIHDADGNQIDTVNGQGQLVTAATIDSSGNVSINPLAYYVDPNGGTTLPGTDPADALSVSDVSCDPASGILSSPLSTTNFSASNGSETLSFTFAASGSPDYPYVAGATTCTATFAAPGALNLATTGKFSITMNQVALGSVAITPPVGPVAPGSTQSFNVTVGNAGNIALSGISVADPGNSNFTVTGWTCSGTGATCPNGSGSGALNEAIATLPVAGSLTYAVTGTVAASPSPAGQISDSATISGSGLACSGGSCVATSNVATVPIVAIAMNETPATYSNNGDPVSYTVTLTNSGGTDFSAATLGDPGVAGLDYGSWTCVAGGGISACPNAGGTGAISESNIVVGANGGTVTYTLLATVTVSSGNITNTATLGVSGNAVCANGSCTASQVLAGP